MPMRHFVHRHRLLLETPLRCELYSLRCLYIASYMKMVDRPVGEVVNRIARLLRRLADQRLAPLGLSAGYLPVLTALMDGEAMSQKALTEHAGIEQPTMAATLARMERDGAIERRPDPGDKRSVLFTLSAETRARSMEIEAAIGKLNDDALARLSRADQERLVACSRRSRGRLKMPLARARSLLARTADASK